MEMPCEPSRPWNPGNPLPSMDDCQTEPRFFLAHSPAKVPKTCETSGFWMFSQLRSIQKNLGPSLTAHLLGSSHDCHRLHFHIISTMEPKQINQIN